MELILKTTNVSHSIESYEPPPSNEVRNGHAAVSESTPVPSLATSIVAGTWKHGSVKKEPTLSESWTGQTPASITLRQATTSSDDSALFDERSMQDYNLSDLSNEVLMQVRKGKGIAGPVL